MLQTKNRRFWTFSSGLSYSTFASSARWELKELLVVLALQATKGRANGPLAHGISGQVLVHGKTIVR